MGYNLGIGEAKVMECLEERRAWVTVDAPDVPGAPLNSSDEYSNWIHPSYSAWSDFLSKTGLYEVFFGGRCHSGVPVAYFISTSGKQYDGLLRNHPGAEPLTEDHYQAFLSAWAACREDPKDPTESMYRRRRLDWLVFWTRWALDNCKYPTFYNS